MSFFVPRTFFQKLLIPNKFVNNFCVTFKLNNEQCNKILTKIRFLKSYVNINDAIEKYAKTFIQMQESIEKLKQNQIDITLYPGHGLKTTLEYEKRTNSFF